MVLISSTHLLIHLISGLLVSMVCARGGPKIDLGPLVDGKRMRTCNNSNKFEFNFVHFTESTDRTCADVMAAFQWIRCEDDGSFSALQCDLESRLCFCLHPNGTRVSRLILRSNRVTNNTCMEGNILTNLR